LLLLAGHARAELIYNGSFTYDNVSGLSWLNLSRTGNMSILGALNQNPGWRLPTNSEVEDLFAQSFEGFYSTLPPPGDQSSSCSSSSPPEYADQAVDVAAFQDLFGLNAQTASYDYSYGLYLDEDGIVRYMGADFIRISSNKCTRVVGTENNYSYPYNNQQTSYAEFGVFLVRSGDSVPATVGIDVDPWSAADAVEPGSDTMLVVAVLGSSIASGDVADFDVQQIDPASLRLGLGEAPNVAVAPLYGDYDQDGNTDAAFAFNSRESGILCGDAEVSLQGKNLDGNQFTGTAAVVTPDCLALSPVLTVTDTGGSVSGVTFYDMSSCGPFVQAEGFTSVSSVVNAAVPGCEFLANWDPDFTAATEASASEPVADGPSISLSNTVGGGMSSGEVAFISGLTGSASYIAFAVSQATKIRVSVLLEHVPEGSSTFGSSSVKLLNEAGSVLSTFASGESFVTVGPGNYKLTTLLRGGLPVEYASTTLLVEVSAVAAIEVDVDPWSAANLVKPDSNDMLIVAVLGSNTASGDAIDFDVAQIAPASLKLGVGEAPNFALNPLYGDYDHDANTDAAFAFRTQDTGVFCDDPEVTLQGETFSGDPFEGTDTIDTIECVTGGCHP